MANPNPGTMEYFRCGQPVEVMAKPNDSNQNMTGNMEYFRFGQPIEEYAESESNDGAMFFGA